MDHKLFHQFKTFLFTSGIGWIIDFSLYSIFTTFLGISVLYANMISSIPAVTFVFIVSIRKTFSNNTTNISLKQKYFIYIIYQFMLLLIISNLGQWLFDIMKTIPWIVRILDGYIKVFIKLIITPVTMTINFLVMKGLIEKL